MHIKFYQLGQFPDIQHKWFKKEGNLSKCPQNASLMWDVSLEYSDVRGKKESYHNSYTRRP